MTQTPVPDERPARRSISENLDHLFKTIRPDPGSDDEYTYAHVQARCTEMGYKISDATVQLIRNGERPNPTASTMEALAKFFGVPVGYFFNEAEQLLVDEELELLVLMQNPEFRTIALRAAGLTSGNRQLLLQVIETMRTISGVPDDQPAAGAADEAHSSPT